MLEQLIKTAGTKVLSVSYLEGPVVRANSRPPLLDQIKTKKNTLIFYLCTSAEIKYQFQGMWLRLMKGGDISTR